MALALFGAGASRIALTLFGSTAIPSLLTMWPNRLPLVTPKTHFPGFKLSVRINTKTEKELVQKDEDNLVLREL